MTSTAQPLHAAQAVAPRRGVLYIDLLLVLMALIWGANISVVKFGTQSLEPLAYNGIRVALAAVALLLIGWALRAPWPTQRDTVALLLLGVLGNGIYQLLFIEGVAHTRAGNASLVLAATPAIIALLSWFRGIETIRARGILGIAISIGGIALVIRSSVAARSGDPTLLGDALVLGGCVCWAVFTVLLKPYMNHVHAVQVAALTMVGGTLPLLVVSAPAIARTSWMGVPPLVWGAIIFSGLGALVLAYLLWYWGVKVVGPTRTSMYANLQPVVGLGAAWLLLGEVPSAIQAMGAASIVTGLLLTRT